MDFQTSGEKFGKAFGLLCSCYMLYLLYIVIYNLYFHPLRNYPGPKSWAATRIPWAISQFSGALYLSTHELHKKYGNVVRIAPDELSFIDPQAWKDIYTARTGKELMHKDERSLAAIRRPEDADTILTVRDNRDHARIRRVLANAFSTKALTDQEYYIQRYVSMFIDSLHSIHQTGPVNMVAWLEFVTFDIIGDLAFGESLNIIKNQQSDWLVIVNKIFRSGFRATTLAFFKHLRPLLGYLLRFSPSRTILATHAQNVKNLMSKRIAADTDRKDFAFYALQIQKMGDPKSLISDGELAGSFQVLMVAGSETSATALSACIFFLSQNREVYTRLTTSVRSSFSAGTDITMLNTSTNTYLIAVLDETLRLMPPVASGQPRIVSREGAEIAGNFVPGGTRVGVPSWATNRSSENFRDPESFRPERWLGDLMYANDQREASNPFSIGPRGCIGRNLANAEMRIILSRLLFEFDVEVMDESSGWLDEARNFGLWTKQPLMVRLTPVVKA